MNTPKYSLAAGVKWIVAVAIAVHVMSPAPMELLVLLLAVDWVTGLAAAYVRSEVSSARGRKGAVTKLMTMLMLWLLYGAEAYARHVTTGSTLPPWMVLPAANTIATGYIVNEAISVVENLALANVPISPKVVGALTAVKRFRIRPATDEELKELDK